MSRNKLKKFIESHPFAHILGGVVLVVFIAIITLAVPFAVVTWDEDFVVLRLSSQLIVVLLIIIFSAVALMFHSGDVKFRQWLGPVNIISKREKLLKPLFESASVGRMLLRADDMSVVLMNKAASNILFNRSLLDVEYVSADGVVIPPTFYPYNITRKNGKTSVRDDFYVRGPGGLTRALMVMANSTEESGIGNFISVTLVDITKFKDAEKTKDDFISLAAHQLRTPASTISWYAEQLLELDALNLSDDQKASVKQIFDSSRRLSLLVNGLLDISRIELGKLQHDEAMLDPAQIATQVLTEARPLATRKHITIHEKIDLALPLVSCGEKVGAMIFQNLLGNAIKYTPDGGEVWFELGFDRGDKGLILTISDSGIGIPEHEASRIFTRFYRASNAKEIDETGSGLGLAIVHLLCTRSGGQIRFKPRTGGGTVFEVRLPFTCTA